MKVYTVQISRCQMLMIREGLRTMPQEPWIDDGTDITPQELHDLLGLVDPQEVPINIPV